MFYNVIKCLAKAVFGTGLRIKSFGNENVMENGGVIYAVNHKSWLDPIMIAVTSKRPLTFIAKKELFKNKLLGGFLKKMGAFPVNRGKGDIGAVKTALSILKEEKVLMIFPEGTRVKKGEKVDAKAGLAMFALHAKVPIIPIKISGNYGFMKKIDVIYGEPIYLDEYYGKKLPTEELQKVSQSVLDTIYALEARNEH